MPLSEVRTPLGGISRRAIGLGVLALTAFGVGYLGQDSWGIGARSAPSAVSAIVTDVVGGTGNRQPVRVQVSLGVTNDGTDVVRVLRPDRRGQGTDFRSLTPSVLILEPGGHGQLEADVAIDCSLPKPLRLADLRIERRDGIRLGLRIGGSGMLLEACSRAATAVRPLVATLDPTPETAAPADARLTVTLSSPTGRRADVTQIRAGGVPLLTLPPAPLTVAGKAEVVVRLTAPRTCPMQWRVAGIPSSLTMDLAPDSGAGPETAAGSSAAIRVRLGPPLTTWLLATACAGSG
jgi:hypothetical protein